MTTDANAIGIFTTDAKLVIRSWNSWLEQMTGVTAGDAQSQGLSILFPELEARNILAYFERVLSQGVVEVLSPAFHHYLFACSPVIPSSHFEKMQQLVTIAPLIDDQSVAGTIVTIEDVTARLDRERDLAEQMGNSNEAVRLQAARAFVDEGRGDSTEPLVGALGDESWRVRRLVVDGLARQGGPDAIKSLLHTLREEHSNLNVVNSALQVLALSGVDAIGPLMEWLTEPDVDLRIYSAQALGEQSEARAIPALLAALKDEDLNVRYHAIEALGKLRALEAVDALTEVAESGDFYLAFPALDALTRIGESRNASRLVPLLEDPMLRVPAADALGQLGDEEMVAPLVGLLNKPGSPALVISKALSALYDHFERSYNEGSFIADLVRKEINATGAHNLLEALDETSEEDLRAHALVLGWLEGEAIAKVLTRLLGRVTARKEVVEALVRHGSQAAMLLIDQLEAEDLETRQAAVAALGRIGDARAVAPLVRVLNKDPELVIGAAGALAKIGDRGAFEALIGLISHRDASVRQAVVAAINSLGHPEMAYRAVSLLNDSNALVRESAVRIAGYFGYAECTELLLERCEDEDEGVRCAAIEHIPYLEDERVIPTLARALHSESARVRASAARAFAQVEGLAASTYLLAALRDSDEWVRYFAARSIGTQAKSSAVDELARLARTDSANHVRIAAMESLGQIGGSRVVAVLAPFAESDETDLARAALAGLGLTDQPDAAPILLAALRSPNPALRMEALRALGKLGGPSAVDGIEWVAAADKDAAVVQTAIDALRNLATPEAITTLLRLTANPELRDASVEALASLGKQKMELISAGLSNAQPAVRRGAVEALGRMKHSQASDLLSTALDDQVVDVRLAAVHALAQLGSRHAERKLVAMARTDPDTNVRRTAQKALRK
jgi:HEAT repeat protein